MYSKKAKTFFGSRLFFRLSMALFILEAAWISISGAYSMAFDENYHLGIIRYYSSRFLPFWSAQPAGADGLGAINRDPSYLYQYLMSFPYRVFSHFVHSEMAQVIFLRGFSIALFVCGILIFRKILAQTGISKAMLHVIIAIFILTPVAPFLAAQLNYDNLLFVGVGTSLVLTQKLVEQLRNKRVLNLKTLILLVGVALLSSLVKYAYLPVLVGILIYLIFMLVKFIRRQKWPKVWKSLRKQWLAFSKVQMILFTLLILVSGGLFMERYGVNMVRYHTPTPECDQVIGVERCLSYGPWRRNYLTYLDKQNGTLPVLSTNPVNYSVTMWGKRITNELFFTVDGTSSNFMTRDPLQITRIFSVATILVGLALFLRWQRELRQRYQLGLLLTVSCVYVALLWTQNYMDFVHLGFPFAIQGRYLIPVLPMLYLFIALGFNRALQGQAYLKPILAFAAILFLCTQGGGAGIYILKSETSWYWRYGFLDDVNAAARQFLSCFTLGN